MSENKTKATSVSPAAYIAAIADEGRRRDCEALSRIMSTVSKQPARMWGTSIVGFGTHRYALASGKLGEICAVGFSSRKGDISIYGLGGEEADPRLLKQLGPYERGKGCLYVRRMADVNVAALEQLIDGAMRRRAAPT